MEFEINAEVFGASKQEGAAVWERAIAALSPEKKERVSRAIDLHDFCGSIVAEYMGSMRSEVSIEQFYETAKKARELQEEIADLRKRLWNIGNNLHGHLSPEGFEFRESIDHAAEFASEAWGGMRRANSALEIASQIKADGQVAGRNGFSGLLRTKPQEALGAKLGAVWVGSGLTLAGSASGDGLDDVLYSIIMEIDGDALPRREDVYRSDQINWLKVLMGKVRKAIADQPDIRNIFSVY